MNHSLETTYSEERHVCVYFSVSNDKSFIILHSILIFNFEVNCSLLSSTLQLEKCAQSPEFLQ